MKEFEKWLKTFYKDHRGYMRYEPKAKQGWRAALEWVKSKLNCEIHPGDVEYFIDKELKS